MQIQWESTLRIIVNSFKTFWIPEKWESFPFCYTDICQQRALVWWELKRRYEGPHSRGASLLNFLAVVNQLKWGERNMWEESTQAVFLKWLSGVTGSWREFCISRAKTVKDTMFLGHPQSIHWLSDEYCSHK